MILILLIRYLKWQTSLWVQWTHILTITQLQQTFFNLPSINHWQESSLCPFLFTSLLANLFKYLEQYLILELSYCRFFQQLKNFMLTFNWKVNCQFKTVLWTQLPVHFVIFSPFSESCRLWKVLPYTLAFNNIYSDMEQKHSKNFS